MPTMPHCSPLTWPELMTRFCHNSTCTHHMAHPAKFRPSCIYKMSHPKISSHRAQRFGAKIIVSSDQTKSNPHLFASRLSYSKTSIYEIEFLNGNQIGCSAASLVGHTHSHITTLSTIQVWWPLILVVTEHGNRIVIMGIRMTNQNGGTGTGQMKLMGYNKTRQTDVDQPENVCS